MKKTIGIVGLGRMGYGIACNLISRRYPVQGYDVAAPCMERFAAAGGTCKNTPAEAGKGVDTLILMVFSPDQIRDVLFGPNGAAAEMKAGSTVIITASVGYQICEEVEQKLSPLHIHLVDTPVRGTAQTSATGELYLMVGASDEAYAANEELLHDMGSEIVRVGKKAGMGQKAKTCMQAFFSLMFEGTCELLALGTASGLDPKDVYSILNDTSAANGIFRATAKNVAQRRFTDTGNPLSILDKDMKIACATAKDFGLTLPALEGISAGFDNSMKSYATEDVWAAMKGIEDQTGLCVQFDFPE